MLKYNEFKNEMIKRIKDYVPNKYKDYSIKVTKVNKINETRDAIFLVDKNKTVNTSPVVYIDDIYSCYLNCGNIENALNKAGSIIAEGFNIPKEQYVPNNNIMDNVVLVVINAEENKELLKTVPHIKFLDLAFVFRWIVNVNDYGFSGAIINNFMVKEFNIKTDKLFEIAKSNTIRLFPPEIEPLKTALKDMNAPEELLKNTPEYPILVLSNIYKIEGAAYIAFDEILEKIKIKLNENFYILPSSINEVLIVPESFVSLEYVRQMVKSVNNTVVYKSEKLSDNIYFYNGDITII